MTRPALASRRALLLAGLGNCVVRPARATPATLRAALADFAAGATPREGRVTLDLASLVENGNAVPVTVRVASPMTPADHVRRIALFTERNPEPGVAAFHLGPWSGRAEVSTRMRLATSQTVVAAAQMKDGSIFTASLDVLVTRAACVEP